MHAIIGPNGAGKTTLIGQLTGEITPNSGAIALRRPRHHRAADLSTRRARAGALVPDHLAAAGFHRARQCRAGGAGACTATRSGSGATRARRSQLREPARAALERVGLGASRRHRRSPSMSHGEQRQLEIAMALATKPQHAAARRADGRHRGRTNPRAWCRRCSELRSEVHDPAGRARHGRGVRARRPHHRAGLWPRHRLRRCRTRSAPTPRCEQRLSRRAACGDASMADATPLLEIDGIETCYGLQPGAVRPVAVGSQRARWSR